MSEIDKQLAYYSDEAEKFLGKFEEEQILSGEQLREAVGLLQDFAEFTRTLDADQLTIAQMDLLLEIDEWWEDVAKGHLSQDMSPNVSGEYFRETYLVNDSTEALWNHVADYLAAQGSDSSPDIEEAPEPHA